MIKGRNRPWFACLFLAGVTALLSTPAPAFMPADQNQDYEVPLRAFDRQNSKSAVAAEAGRLAVERLTRSFDGDWRVYTWNPETNTPRWIYGSGAQVSSPFGSEGDVVNVSRDIVRNNPEAFRADPSQLRYLSAPRGAGKWAVHFQQTHQMIDVVGGRVSLTYTEEGRLVALGSSYYAGIQVDVHPTIDADQAKLLARRDLPFNPATDSIEDNVRLEILPVPANDGQVEYHLAWHLRIRTEDPVGIWVTYLDAHDAEILWRYNDVHFLDYAGTTDGLIQRPTYCEGQQQETLPYLRVTVNGLPAVIADGDGNWTVPYSGTDARAVTADLYGPYVDLNNVAGAEATFNGTATPGVPLAVSFTDANAQRDEKDVYRAVNDIHDFFQQFAPEFPYANQRITANVSRNSTCNAYWDGTINFYIQGGGCANTGEIMDVVQHEFGHGVQAAILGFQGGEGLGEGNSDVLGNIMQMSPIVGRGFYLNNCTSGIRNSDNGLVYPDDVVGQQIHYAGQVIAGFHWDAMEALILTHGATQGRLIAARNWHYGRVLQHPTTQPDQVLATFIADDDDGNLTNGTPNYDAYCLGAEGHGFDCPEILVGVVIQHVPLATREEAGPASVPAVIYSTEGTLEADSVRVHYRLNGGEFQSVAMEPGGGPNEYVGVIPDLAAPTSVEYFLRARDALGNTRNHPALAPALLHDFDVATEYDPLETDSGWSVNSEGSDNATTGAWVRVDPNGTSAQPENDYTPDPGVFCWVTGNAPPGSGDGTADVDGGTTTLYSPVYDLTDAASALVKFRRWYSNDRGAAPGADTWAVQVRNNGEAWVNLESTQQSSNAWVEREFDLLAQFGPTLSFVELKFIASDLSDPSLVEAAVDELVILAQLGGSAGVGSETTGPPRFALWGTQPNPSPGDARIRFQVPASSPVRLSIYDVSGRQVRDLSRIVYEVGTHEVLWDGRDDGGREAASGVYFVRMDASGYQATRTLVLRRR